MVTRMKTLVVYYSRTGVTRQCAQTLAKTVGAEIEEIADPTRRGGFIGFMRSGYEASLNRLVRIGDLKHNPKDFDLVVVCTPVWAGKPASPVTTFIKKYQSSIRNIAILLTHGWTDACEGAALFIETSVGHKSLKTLSIDSESAKKPGCLSLSGFANELNKL